MAEIDDIRKATGKVYQILTEVMERYWNKKSQLYHWKLCDELLTRKKEAYMADHLLPHLFYDAMADAVLRWHDKEFKGIADNEIKPLFQALWKYHRQYLGMVLRDDVVESFIKGGDAIIAEQDEESRGIVTRMVMAIMHDLEWRNPKEGDVA